MSKRTLASQLAGLVVDFGYDNVRKTLSAINRKKAAAAKRAAPQKAVAGRVCKTANAAKRKRASVLRGASVKSVNISRPRKKPDAVAVVAAMNLEDSEKRNFLAHLAKKYEAKEFMPQVGHVRMFLENESQFIPSGNSRIKSRQQVTVKVFKKLAAMSLRELRDLEFYGAYDPPKRLATYAAAIENFGRNMRASR